MGSCPEWNETFLFTITGNVEEISVKIMDKDTGSSDDFVGEAKYVYLYILVEKEKEKILNM